MQEKKQDVNKLSVNDVINQISSEWRRYIYSKVDLRKVSINNGLNLRSHDNIICLLDAFQFYRRQSKVVSLPLQSLKNCVSFLLALIKVTQDCREGT